MSVQDGAEIEFWDSMFRFWDLKKKTKLENDTWKVPAKFFFVISNIILAIFFIKIS